MSAGKLDPARIEVRDRRRQEYGDLAGLARSLSKWGLLHPITVCTADGVAEGNRLLVAGERRLRAAKQLGWTAVEVRDLGRLDDETIAAIELAENDDRKDLTPAERSRLLVRKAAEVAADLPSQSEGKTPRGEARTYAAPKADVADALGMSVGALVKAEQHVAAVERYPELEEAPQSVAIEAARTFDALPEPVRLQVRDELRATDDTPKPVSKAHVDAVVERALKTVPGASDEIDQAKLRAAFSRALVQALNLIALDTESLADVMTDGHWVSFNDFANRCEGWINEMRRERAARTSGLRLVGGAD